MWIRFVLPLVLGVLAGAFDVAVAVWLPGPWAAVRAALPLVILLAVFSRPQRVVIAAIAAGVVLDAFQPAFDLATLRLLGVVAVMMLVARLYVTNRSLLGSLTLGGVGFATDRFIRWMIQTVHALLDVESIPSFAPPVIPELLWIAFCLTVAFWVFAAFTRRFMPLVSRR